MTKDRVQEEASEPPGMGEAPPPWQACQARGPVPGAWEQDGLAALLSGDQLAIIPEGFQATHQRLTRIRWAPTKKTAALARPAGSD